MIDNAVVVKRLDSYDLEKIIAFLKRGSLNKTKVLPTLIGKTILIKPNLLGGYSPDKAVTTHPTVIEAVVSILKGVDCKILIGDSPGGAVNYKKVCETAGITALAEKYDIEVVNFNKYKVIEVNVDGYDIAYSSIFDEVDYIINLAKYKTHSLMQFTGAVKNLYGLIPGLKKADYHRIYPNSGDFAKFVAKIYSLFKPKLLFSLIDGIIGMEGKGPSGGAPRNFGILFTSKKASALDYVASYLMGFKPMTIELVRLTLHDDGVLPSKIASNFLWQNNIFPNVDIGVVKMRNRFLNLIPPFANNLFQRLFWYKPVITDRCKLCNLCVKSCPVDAINKTESGKLVIDDAKCIRCLCCHEFCTFKAIDIKKSNFAEKLLPTEKL